MHLARRAVRAIWTTSPKAATVLLRTIGTEHPGLPPADFEESVEDAVGAVALTHDLGHPPFSHALEQAFHTFAEPWFDALPAPYGTFAEVKAPFHEVATTYLLHQLVADLREEDDASHFGSFLDLVLHIAGADPNKDSWASTLHGLIAGELDIDRLDYVMRDAQRAGTEFGSLDHIRLVDNTELHIVDRGESRFRLGVGVRARSAAESLLVQRAQSYRWIIFHHRVVASNLALSSAFAALVRLRTSDLRLTLTDGTSPQLRNVFSFRLDLLNYLSPALRVPVSVAPGSEIRSDPRASATNEEAHVLACRVDDGLVSQLLFDALAVSEQLASLVGDPPPANDDAVTSLLHFRACARSALLREKRLIPVWKTIDEQKRIAEKVLHNPQVVAKVRAAIERLMDDYQAHDASTLYLTKAAVGVLERLERPEHRMSALNMIFDETLSAPRNRNRLAGLLQQKTQIRTANVRGAWLVSYTGWSSLRSEGRQATVFANEEPEHLREGSPLVAAMDVADELRLSTLLYFCLHDVHVLPELDDRNIFQAAARQAVRLALPTFIERDWVEHLRRKAAEFRGR